MTSTILVPVAKSRLLSIDAFRGVTVLLVVMHRVGVLGLMLAMCCGEAQAATAQQPAQTVSLSPLQSCLKRADDLPDIAAAEATAWIKKGGGNDAHLCRAFAQANRGMHEDAAREFWALGSFFDKHDIKRAVAMHNLSGQEFLRVKKPKDAEAQYADSLKLMPRDATSLIGHAESRMAQEKYWDALDDLNKVLKANPGNVEALRQRGRAWTQLGNDKNAQEDFDHAETLAPLPPEPPETK